MHRNTPIKEFKTVLVGDSGVGKSSILQYLLRRTFNPVACSTIGAAFATYVQEPLVPENPVRHRFSIWDTAGQERFRNIVDLYFRNSRVILLVYDVTQPESLLAIRDIWSKISEKHTSVEESIIVLVENKIDQPHDPQITEVGKEFADQRGYLFVRTSASRGEGIHTMFEMISAHITNRCIAPVKSYEPLLIDHTPPTAGWLQEWWGKCTI